MIDSHWIQNDIIENYKGTKRHKLAFSDVAADASAVAAAAAASAAAANSSGVAAQRYTAEVAAVAASIRFRDNPVVCTAPRSFRDHEPEERTRTLTQVAIL